MNDIKTNSQNELSIPHLSGESWRVFQIMAEFEEGFEKLSNICSYASMFESFRTSVDDKNIYMARRSQECLSTLDEFVEFLTLIPTKKQENTCYSGN